ncbi:MAG: hypothetical protein DMG88_21030 [Acidobacteria bacterium]|nr:MAG: hypothetical protein DMG88_21030 [Acidobacteriota bacterium]
MGECSEPKAELVQRNVPILFLGHSVFSPLQRRFLLAQISLQETPSINFMQVGGTRPRITRSLIGDFIVILPSRAGKLTETVGFEFMTYCSANRE